MVGRVDRKKEELGGGEEIEKKGDGDVGRRDLKEQL